MGLELSDYQSDALPTELSGRHCLILFKLCEPEFGEL